MAQVEFEMPSGSQCRCLVYSWVLSLALRKGLDWTHTSGSDGRVGGI